MATGTEMELMRTVVDLTARYRAHIDGTAAHAFDLRNVERDHLAKAKEAGWAAAQEEAKLAEVAGKTLAELLARLGVREANDVARLVGQAQQATAKAAEPKKKRPTPRPKSPPPPPLTLLAVPATPPTSPEAIGMTVAALRRAITPPAMLNQGRVKEALRADDGHVYAVLFHQYDDFDGQETFGLYQLGPDRPVGDEPDYPVGVRVFLRDRGQLWVQDGRREVVVAKGQGGR